MAWASWLPWFLAGVAFALLAQLLVSVLRPAPPLTGPSPQPADVELRLSEPFLSELVREEVARSVPQLSFGQVRVDASPGQRLELLGEATLLVVTAPFSIALRPAAVDGTLVLHVVSFSFGGLGLPTALLGGLETRLNERIRVFAAQPNVRLLGASTTESELVFQLAVELQPSTLSGRAGG